MVQPSTTTPQHFQRSMPTPGHVEQPSMPTSSHDQVLHRQLGLDGSRHTPTNKQELLLANQLISTAQLIPIHYYINLFRGGHFLFSEVVIGNTSEYRQ